MTWEKKITQLNDVLSDLVPIQDGIPKYVLASGLKLQHISFGGSAMDIWSNVLAEAEKQNKLDELVHSVLKTYPDNPFLKSALSEKEISYSLGPDIKMSDWEDITDDTLEVLTLGQSTLLPVNFLARGVLKSKSVGKVEIKVSGNRYNVGTGFLCKVKGIEDLFFITNYHVINNKEEINRTKIIFDYELDIYGDTIQSKSFVIDIDGPWYCSPVGEFDTTVFKLKGDDDKLSPYGYLELNEVDITKNDFVNIIQHPGGELKQISLYHNIVTNTTDRVVQYLTDTLKGSSGSPVFNSDWEVIALHHSGGGIKEGEPDLPLGIKSRNEGIYINRIIEFIKENHIK